MSRSIFEVTGDVEAGVPRFAEVKFLTGIPFGHAFVNFISPSASHEFRCLAAEFEKQELILSWADVQGLEEQIKRYRNSPVMHRGQGLARVLTSRVGCQAAPDLAESSLPRHRNVPEAYKPIIFKDGVRMPFPAPSEWIKPPKIRMCRQR